MSLFQPARQKHPGRCRASTELIYPFPHRGKGSTTDSSWAKRRGRVISSGQLRVPQDLPAFVLFPRFEGPRRSTRASFSSRFFDPVAQRGVKARIAPVIARPARTKAEGHRANDKDATVHAALLIDFIIITSRTDLLRPTISPFHRFILLARDISPLVLPFFPADGFPRHRRFYSCHATDFGKDRRTTVSMNINEPFAASQRQSEENRSRFTWNYRSGAC